MVSPPTVCFLCATYLYPDPEILQIADHSQQSFSSDQYPTLQSALPALEVMHQAWMACASRPEYAVFGGALDAGLAKVSEYYEKTSISDVYTMAMRELSYSTVAQNAYRVIYICQQFSTLPRRTGISKRIGSHIFIRLPSNVLRRSYAVQFDHILIFTYNHYLPHFVSIKTGMRSSILRRNQAPPISLSVCDPRSSCCCRSSRSRLGQRCHHARQPRPPPVAATVLSHGFATSTGI